MKDKTRVIMVKLGLDGHWRGITTVSLILKNAGMEVIFAGFQTIESAISIAEQEDVDVIGLSIHSGAHIPWTRKFVEALNERKLKDEFVLVVGGVIPDADVDALREIGADGIYGPGSTAEEIVRSIQEKVKEKRI
ncbi:MAG: cobalamin-dependent protein [Syntrophobacterales bacterium]|nr:cobalamin-dependent protein [Syntrophobacterales bacterium]